MLDRGELEISDDGTIATEDEFHGDVYSLSPNAGTINVNSNVHFVGNVSENLKTFHVNGDHTWVSESPIFDKKK